MTLVEFDRVCYTYPGSETPAINGLNLSIKAGQKNAIVGQNGSGKSTLLFLADGLYKVQQGKIRWQTETLNYNPKFLRYWRQRIGLAFQDPEQQLVAGTVREDISYGLCNLGLPRREIEQRLERAIADFGLLELAEKPLHHLSLGQKRRVALAGVMVLKPQLLLLDEPTAYLDRVQTRYLMAELERIHGEGTTILMATHDLNLAFEWSDWIFIIHQGKLAIEGTAEEVFARGEIMEELQLSLPLLWEVWEALPRRPQNRVPKTIGELREQLLTNF